MRYVVYGAGAIGGGIGALLFRAGRDVTLICRGAHLEAVRKDGLMLRTPDENVSLPVPAVANPAEIAWRGDEVVLLTMKSQDTRAALEALRSAAGDVPVVCAQNGVANEHMAARLFSRVYGTVVVMPATHLQPGEVLLHSAPVGGMLDAGCYPTGSDDVVCAVTQDLSAAGFVSQANEAIMRLKYAKLLNNLANIVQAVCGTGAAAGDIVRQVRSEAIACYDAAGIVYATPDEMRERSAGVTMRPVQGAAETRGGSTWQSLTRHGSLETDYLNGEISLLGALHGVPTPYNRMLQAVAVEAARDGGLPGSYTVEELMARV